MRFRHWILLLIPLGAVPPLIWVWVVREASRQANFVSTYTIASITILALFLWLLLLSGLRWRTRFACVGAIIIAGAASAALFRIGGVTGDLVPILEWRFVPQPGDSQVSIQTRSEARTPASPEHGQAAARDYPQFLGPGRNATLNDVQLERDWDTSPPRLLWRQEVGAAWSAFSVAGDAAFTQEQRGAEELVTCYDLRSGALRWSHADRARYEKVIGGIGPRATPTVTENRVYTMGATGILNCLDRATGKRRWMRQAVEENGAKVNSWGMSGSPLVVGRLVVVLAGGANERSMIAYDKESGAPLWHGGHDRPGYSSPLHTVLAGAPQILALNHSSVVAQDPATGQVLWQQPWPKGNPNVAQPLPLPGDRVLVSSGYGDGCALFQVKKSAAGELSAEVVWKTKSLKAKFANFAHRDGFVYGLDDGILVCLDLETGKRRWKQGRYGHGQMILVDDVLLVMAEAGELVLIEAIPEEHRVLSRLGVLGDKTWNSPALAAPYLLVRNDREAACYELALVADKSQEDPTTTR